MSNQPVVIPTARHMSEPSQRPSPREPSQLKHLDRLIINYFLKPWSFGVACDMITGNWNILFYVFLRVCSGHPDGLAIYFNLPENRLRTVHFTNHLRKCYYMAGVKYFILILNCIYFMKCYFLNLSRLHPHNFYILYFLKSSAILS